MSYSIHYKNSIWTTHALERLKDRNIPQHEAWQAFNSPEQQTKGKSAGTTEFRKTIQGRDYTIIASQNNKREWIILSCWVHPPFTGSIDIPKKKAYLKYKNSSTWGKIWIQIKRAFGFYENF